MEKPNLKKKKHPRIALYIYSSIVTFLPPNPMTKKHFLLVFLFVMSASFSSIIGQVSGNRLKVSGESIVYDVPEEMVIRIPFEIKDTSYNRCTELLISRYNRLVNNFKRIDIGKDEIKIENMNIEENSSWENIKKIVDGYTGSLSIILMKKFDSQTLNKIVKVINESNLKVLYSVEFQLSESQKKILLEKSIENAILDAKTKANIIAKSMGFQLINLLEVNYGYVNEIDELTSGSDRVTISVADIAGNDSEGVMDLNPQKMKIEKSISIIWDIKQ